MIKIFPKLAYAVLICILLSNCTAMRLRKDWETATSQNKVEAYEEFIKAHPYSIHDLDARSRIMSLKWEKACIQNSLEAYEEFRKSYPDSIHDLDAQTKIINLRWAEVQKQAIRNGYEQFLKNYPNSRFSNKAKNAIDNIDWNEAKKSNSFEAYQEYLTNYPGGLYLEQAKDLRDDRLWDQAINQNTIQGYNFYLTTITNGRHKESAKERIKSIRENSLKPIIKELSSLLQSIPKIRVENKIVLFGMSDRGLSTDNIQRKDVKIQKKVKSVLVDNWIKFQFSVYNEIRIKNSNGKWVRDNDFQYGDNVVERFFPLDSHTHKCMIKPSSSNSSISNLYEAEFSSYSNKRWSPEFIIYINGETKAKKIEQLYFDANRLFKEPPNISEK